MLRQLTIYLPTQLTGINPNTLRDDMAFLKLLKNANAKPAQVNATELFFAQLAIAPALAKVQGITLAKPCLIAQPIKIYLDQTQGYLQVVPPTQVSQETMQLLDKYLQQQWADQVSHMQFIADKFCWLVWPKAPLAQATLFRPQASTGMAINAFVPKVSANSAGVWFNDSQLLLHQFNQKYPTPINAFWFWGNGLLEQIEYDCIITQDDFIASFATANSIACYAGMDEALLCRYKNILYIAVDSTIQSLEQEVFAPSWQALKRKILTQIKLEAAPSYQFICNASTFKKWWQKTATLEQILNDHR